MNRGTNLDLLFKSNKSTKDHHLSKLCGPRVTVIYIKGIITRCLCARGDKKKKRNRERNFTGFPGEMYPAFSLLPICLFVIPW